MTFHYRDTEKLGIKVGYTSKLGNSYNRTPVYRSQLLELEEPLTLLEMVQTCLCFDILNPMFHHWLKISHVSILTKGDGIFIS